ncbi:polysaccharide biosynthesis C-terminal domain-containing protein [Mucilaginibacter sp. dw_454]|uniref:lipopolysaccharide biosynthesis protein n=1 Tax=Mucilaginibacter sp. dw_454 TaxID=2720079 RepID=UPI001BD31644|nr:polysaccharide biosynthesis C-terminal domain-containing protein [Mucilaginibacter sp. dw_454]
MGIVKKQAYKNTLVSYGGMVIAYINTVLLFPFFVNASEYGFYNLIISISVLYALVASMGVPSILAKYFPHYRTDDKKHNGFMHWSAGLVLLGFIAATALFIVFKPLITSMYAHTDHVVGLSRFKSSGTARAVPFLVEYYYYLIPLSFFVLAFNYLEMTGRIIYQTIYSNFLQNVLLRLLTTALLIMIALKWINFEDFIFLYIASNGVISLLLLISIIATKNFSYKLDGSSFKNINKREILGFGIFTLVSSAIYVLLQKVDTLMLSSIVGDDIQGVYSWYFNIAIVISVPAQALSRTTYAIVADAWKADNRANIMEVYYKTSIIQMVVGCLLFVGIIVNRENLYAIARNKEFTDPKYFSLFIVIGLGFLVDITGGLNTYIITTSHKYKLITGLVIFAVVFCVGLNYILIPKYYGMGAAISYLLTTIGINFATWFYIKYRFKMQPFNYKHLLVLVVAVVGWATGHYFWRMPNVLLDIAVRSCVTALAYGLLAYLFKISTDINDKVDATLKKIFSLVK